MNKKILIALIAVTTITCSARAEFDGISQSDYTGEAFFLQPTPTEVIQTPKERPHTTPPVKKMRLWLQGKKQATNEANSQFAPMPSDTYRGEVETSEYASKDLEDDFEEMSPDGFEADSEAVNDKKSKKSKSNKKSKDIAAQENTEEIILDCDKVDYDTPNYLIYARGNVSVEFVKQKTVVKADLITFDRINNTIKAEGNVRIVKNGQAITGDYIFVDMNEENALIENPVTVRKNIEIRAKKGYVYGDKIVQEQGSMVVNDDYPIEFHSANKGPHLSRMIIPKDETLSEDMEKGIVKFTAKDIKITQKGDLETVAIKKGRLYKGGKTIFKVPAVKLYTNKNHDYGESNFWEVGSYRGLGVYTGPGWVFELPKGSVLKAIPMLNYKSGVGVGAIGRFSSGTNQTTVAYGTAASRFFAYGRQELDDNLFMQYGMNSYMDEWFLGRRRPKYGASLVYNKSYGSKGFLIPDRMSMFAHRLEGGYFHNLDFDSNFEKIRGASNMGTTRFRYMAMGSQELFGYTNEEKLKSLSLRANAQLSSAIYGTGDTQVIGRVGPMLHSQYRRWMQDIGYYFSVYDDESPMSRYDAYRYGKQNMYLREYLRLCRWLTVSWFASINMTNDAPNGKRLQENAFYLSFGPDDIKISLGYDFIRENLYCFLEIMMDAKGTQLEYDRLELRQDKKASQQRAPERKTDNAYQAPTSEKVLQRAVVEDVKVMEDVL